MATTATVTRQQFDKLKEEGEQVFIYRGRVFKLDSSFMHPGGNKVKKGNVKQPDVNFMLTGKKDVGITCWLAGCLPTCHLTRPS
jgi:hypothetical protein